MPAVNISTENNDKIIELIKNDGCFVNVESFINYVLSEVFRDEKINLSIEEQDIINGRLKALGYL